MTRIGLDRTTFAWCSAAAFAALLPLSLSLQGWLVALLVLLILLGAGFGWSGRRLSPWIRLPLTIGVAGVVLYAHGFRFGRDTGAALLVTMLALKLLETRNVRDARSILGFALFAIMAGFLQSQAPAVMLLALLGTVLVLAAMLRVTEAEFVVPAAYLPLTQRRRLLASLRLLLLSLPLAFAAFFFFPRLGSPLWGLPENVAGARTGLSDDMSPGDIANLFSDDSPAFRVQFDGAAPSPGEMYWRGPVLSAFDGRRWFRDGMDMHNRPPAELVPRGAALDYEITFEPTDRRYLVALDLPVFAPAETTLGSDRSMLTRRPVGQLRQYRVRSYPRYRFEPELLPTLRQRSTMLPGGFNPRTVALVDGWRAAGAADREVISRALQMFRGGFTYTLTPMLLGRDSVDDFLFGTRQGYCEHFASAFIVMMRAADIPARVVTGYQGGYQNAIGGYWIVRQSDAHAWAEVWLEGEGWVRIDPTSAVAPERIQRGSDVLGGRESEWERYGQPLLDAGDWLRRNWNDLVLGFDAARQRNLLQPFGIPDASTAELGIALVVFVGLALALTLVVLLRAPRTARDPLRIAWYRFLRRLERAGLPKSPHEGPVAFGERAAASLPAAADQVVALSQRYARRRYAAGQADDGADQALCDALRRFRVPKQTRQRSSA
jgi:transglutaminase-like putative cysteine protease